MKEIIVGDTHGRKDWQAIANQEKDWTKFRFIGDYWDSFNIPFEQQWENFKDIIAFKEANPDKVELLIGNHDFHYLRESAGETYSGYQSWRAKSIFHLMQPYVDDGYFQVASLVESILFTHAGVSNTWLSETGIVDSPNIANSINKLFKEKPEFFRFRGYDPTGDDPRSGPLWIRPRSLVYDSVAFVQVVGHTRMKNIAVSNDRQFWFIDVLEENAKKYLILTEEGLKIGEYAEERQVST